MCVKAYKVEWFLPCQTHAIREFPSCFTSSVIEMQYSLSMMMQDQYLCFVCLGVTDVSLAVCNLAPWLLPGHAHLLPEVQWSHWHTNCWRDSSVCMFSSFPWVILRGNAAHAPHFICVRTLRLIVSTSKASAWSCFFSLPHFFLLWLTMFVPTFQPLPWQLVSAYWVTCLTPWVEPAVEWSAGRWRQVGEMIRYILSWQAWIILTLRTNS